MKRIVLAALAFSLSTGAMAQTKKSKEEADNLRLYYTSLECAQAAGALPIYDTSMTEAQKADYLEQATTWLILAGVIDDKIGRNLDQDFEQEAYRTMGLLDLLGNAEMVKRLKSVQVQCNKIYLELKKG